MKESELKKFDLDKIPIKHRVSYAGVLSGIFSRTSFSIPGTKYESSQVLEFSSMKRFLEFMRCSKDEAKEILLSNSDLISQNSNSILLEKSLDVSPKIDGKKIIPLVCCMAQILVEKTKLRSFLNITQDDIIVIARMESAFNPASQNHKDCGIFQINEGNIKDLIQFSGEISKTMEKAGAQPYTLKDLGITVKNYQTELKDLSKAMAVFALVIYRKLQIALADSRAAGSAAQFTRAKKYGGGKKRNLAYKAAKTWGDSNSSGQTSYFMNNTQKRYFFSDYYNANGKLVPYEIDYGLNFLAHKKELNSGKEKNEAVSEREKSESQFAQKKKSRGGAQEKKSQDFVQAKKEQSAPVSTSGFLEQVNSEDSKKNASVYLKEKKPGDSKKKKLEEFERLLKKKYSQNEKSASFWAQNFSNSQEGINQKQDSKLFSVLDLLNLSLSEMEAIVQAVWDISENKFKYSLDSKWTLYDSALTFDANSYGSDGNKRALVRWFARSLQTAMSGGTELEGDKGEIFRLVLKAAKNNFKYLPGGGIELLEKIRTLDKALVDLKNRLA